MPSVNATGSFVGSSHRRSKPWLDVGIDTTHPLAQGLVIAIPFNEGSDSPREIVNKVKPSSIAHLTWGSGFDGNVAIFNGTNTTITYPEPAFPTFPGFTALARCSFNAPSTGTQTIFKCYTSSQLCALSNATGSLQLAGSTGARASWTMTGINANEYHTYVATDIGTNPLLYTDGVKTVTSLGGGTGNAATISGNLYIGSTQITTNLFAGNLSLLLFWNRALTATEVSQISINPWQVFQPVWPRGLISTAAVSFIMDQQTLPTHLSSGSVSIEAMGSGTSWTSNTRFSVSGVPGWSVASQFFITPGVVSLTLSCPISDGPTGTLVVSDGTHTAGIHINMATLSANIATMSIRDSTTVTFTGTNTLWETDPPNFSISGSAGATISNISVISDTSATAVVYSGTSIGATMTITGMATGASTTIATQANTVITNSCIMRGGQLWRFAFANSSNQPTAITAISAFPTFYKNGSPISCLGPIWSHATHTDPFCFFQLPTTASVSDVYTFAAASGWATTSAGAATSYYGGATINSTGSLEPALYGGTPLNYLPTNTGGLQVGFNIGGSINTNIQGPGWVCANWFKRGSWTGGGATLGTDGGLLTFTGSPSTNLVDNTIPNYIQDIAFPDLEGTWTLVIDDTNVTHPLLFGLTVNSHAATVTSGPTTPSVPNVSTGSNQNGVLVGRIWQWKVAWVNNPTAQDLALTLTVSASGGSSPYNYTAQNEWLWAPQGNNDSGGVLSMSAVLNRSNPAKTDYNFLKWLSTGNKGAASLRSSIAGYNGAQSNNVNVADIRALTDSKWYGNKTSLQISITTIRSWSLGTTPNLYFAENYPGTTASGNGPGNLAYQFTPGTTKFPDWGGIGPGHFIMEMVTATPHGFYSGQLVGWSGTLPTIQTTNGNSGNVNYTFGAASITSSTPYGFCLYVTSATTFVLWGYNAAITDMSLPYNTIGVTYNVPGGTPFYANVVHPDATGLSSPVEVIAQAAASIPGCTGYAMIPILATTALVQHIASAWLNYLPVGRDCYVEVGNEPWNTGFFQGYMFNSGIAQMAGSPWTTNPYDGGYALNATRIGGIFRAVWAAVGRGSSVKCTLNSQAAGVQHTTSIITALNTYNTANPTTPLQLDSITVAPYLDISAAATAPIASLDIQMSPSVAATVAATGGGSSGGLLAAGTYTVSYTYIDTLTGYESAVQAYPGATASTSTSFTVSSGNKPRVTFNDVLPGTVASRNLYITNSTPTTYLYATGVTAATYDMVAALPGSPTSPPFTSLAPSYTWLAASLAALDTNSIANTGTNPGNPYAANPLNPRSWHDYLRTRVKYDMQYMGPTGTIAGTNGHIHQLSLYHLVNNQAAPTLTCYEGSLETLVPKFVQNAATPPAGHFLCSQIASNVFYHPDMYDTEMAFEQALQQSKVTLININALATPFGNTAYTVHTWGYVFWTGQQAGRGDNSDGKGTNVFCGVELGNTPTAHDATNVSPRLQAFLDWTVRGNKGNPAHRKAFFPAMSSAWRSRNRAR